MTRARGSSWETRWPSWATTRIGTALSFRISPNRSKDSPSNPLFCEPVFRSIKERLFEGGIYVLQASTAGFHNSSLHAKMARTLRRHYAHVTSYYTHVPAFDNDWAFIACSDRVDLAALDQRRIDAYCQALRGENFFYDAETHRRIFALPLYLRRELAKRGETF